MHHSVTGDANEGEGSACPQHLPRRVRRRNTYGHAANRRSQSWCTDHLLGVGVRATPFGPCGVCNTSQGRQGPNASTVSAEDGWFDDQSTNGEIDRASISQASSDRRYWVPSDPRRASRRAPGSDPTLNRMRKLRAQCERYWAYATIHLALSANEHPAAAISASMVDCAPATARSSRHLAILLHLLALHSWRSNAGRSGPSPGSRNIPGVKTAPGSRVRRA